MRHSTRQRGAEGAAAPGVVAGRVGVVGVPAVVMRVFINMHVCFHFCACLGVRAYVCTLVRWHMCVCVRVCVSV